MKYKYFFLFSIISFSFSLKSSESPALSRKNCQEEEYRCLWCGTDLFKKATIDSCTHDEDACKKERIKRLKDAEGAGLIFRRDATRTARRNNVQPTISGEYLTSE